MVGRLKLNEFDIDAINTLRRNSRETFTNLAHKHNKAVNTVFSRVNNLSKYVNSFKSIFDFKELGYNIQILFVGSYSGELLELIKQKNNLNTLQVCGPEKKIFATLFFNSLFEFEEFKSETSLEGEKTEYYTVNPVSEEFFML